MTAGLPSGLPQVSQYTRFASPASSIDAEQVQDHIEVRNAHRRWDVAERREGKAPGTRVVITGDLMELHAALQKDRAGRDPLVPAPAGLQGGHQLRRSRTVPVGRPKLMIYFGHVLTASPASTSCRLSISVGVQSVALATILVRTYGEAE